MFGSNFLKENLNGKYGIFNRLAKNSASPPVKIIIKFGQTALYSSMKPSISYAKPFTTQNEWIEVDFPTKPSGLCNDNKATWL
jgi:hypothetical protein